MGLPLITRAEYKAYISISSPNSDDIIDVLIPKVSDFVKNYCRRTFIDFVNDSKTEISNGGYGSSIFTKEYPILTVSEVGYSVDYGQNYVPLAEFTEYVVDWENDSILSLDPNGFSKLINGYQITYTAGYETVPEDLKLAVMDLLTYYIKNDMAVHSPKAPGTNSVQVEYITTSALPAHIRRVLDLYKGSWD